MSTDFPDWYQSELNSTDNDTSVRQTIAKPNVVRRFVVFTNGDEEGMVQLSNSLDDIEKARSFCNAWKSKQTFIYEFIENG